MTWPRESVRRLQPLCAPAGVPALRLHQSGSLGSSSCHSAGSWRPRPCRLQAQRPPSLPVATLPSVWTAVSLGGSLRPLFFLGLWFGVLAVRVTMAITLLRRTAKAKESRQLGTVQQSGWERKTCTASPHQVGKRLNLETSVSLFPSLITIAFIELLQCASYSSSQAFAHLIYSL